jgi:hypothetical protein
MQLHTLTWLGMEQPERSREPALPVFGRCFVFSRIAMGRSPKEGKVSNGPITERRR